MATSEALVEQTTRHSVFLERLKAGEVKRFEPFLQEMDEILRDRLSRADLTAFQRRRVERLVAEVSDLLGAVMDRYGQALKNSSLDLADYEAEFEARSLNEVLTGSYEAVVPAVEQVRSAVLTVPLSVRGSDGGKLLEPFIRDWSRQEVVTISNRIRQGAFEGETTQDIIRSIRGTKAARYTDGLLAVTNRHAEAISRTALQHVASVARQETWKANEDLVTGYRWVSTLDSRTTIQCRSLDGQVFRMGKGPVPPIHVNCRSSTVAELSNRFAWLQEDATRASKDGYANADLSYYEWLKKQPASFQNETLGKTRAELFRKGGLSAEEFARLNLNRNFMPLTLAEMKAKEPLAFERAGL